MEIPKEVLKAINEVHDSFKAVSPTHIAFMDEELGFVEIIGENIYVEGLAAPGDVARGQQKSLEA
jgi:hypothetical protein